MASKAQAKGHEEQGPETGVHELAPQRAGTEGPAAQRERLHRALRTLRAALDEVEAALGTPDADTATLAQHELPTVARDVMKPREYAEHMRVTVRKVHGWIKRGMPHFLVEGRIRVRTAEADAWLVGERADAPAGAEGYAKRQHKKSKKTGGKARKTKGAGHEAKRAGSKNGGKSKRSSAERNRGAARF